MNFFNSTFTINLINYSEQEILINVKNLKIDFNINTKKIKDIIINNYKELEIKFINLNTLDFSILLTINRQIPYNHIINPDNNHLYYLNKYNTKLTDSMFVKYNIIGLAIIGLIIKDILDIEYNIKLFTHVNSVGNIFDKVDDYLCLYNDMDKFSTDNLPIIDPRAKILIQKQIIKAVNEKKYLSGSLQTLIYNLPKGLGIPYFNLFESTLARVLYLIPNLKSLEFCNVIDINYNRKNITKNIYFDNDKLIYESNINASIEQGITTGEILSFNTHFLPSIDITNNTKSINYKTLENVFIKTNNNDYFTLHKQIFVVEGLSAIAIFDLLKRQA